LWRQLGQKQPKAITNFEECVAAGNPILESYPRRCQAKDGQTFTEVISNASDLIPADSESPAAGVCVEPGIQNTIRVEINADVPSPRCQKILPGRRLLVINNTDKEVSLWFGQEEKFSFTVPAQGRNMLEQPISSLLAPGVHVLHGSPYQGPEIWLVAEGTR